MSVIFEGSEISSASFRCFSKQVIALIDRFPCAHAARVDHINHVAKLLDDIGARIEAGAKIDVVTALDLHYAYRDTLTLTQIEELALKVLGETTGRLKFSAQWMRDHKSPHQLASREDQLAAEDS